MRLFARYLLTPILVLLLAGQAFAQVPGNTTPGSFGTPLFQSGHISQALGLTPQQMAQLNAANNQLQAQFRRERLQAQFNDPQRFLAMQELMRAYNAELMGAAATIMTPAQLDRYQQLELQNKGFDAFADVQVQRRLSMAEAQLQRLQALNEQANQQLQAVLQNQANQQELLRRYQVWQQQNLNQVNPMLYPAPQQTWSPIVVQPYYFPPPDLTSPGQ